MTATPQPTQARTHQGEDREIISVREFPVSCQDIYNAFADPLRLARWWGPKGFTNTIEQFELRPGGTWKNLMHSPDGQEYPNVSRFVEVVPNSKIVFRHVEPVHGFEMTMTMEPCRRGSRLAWRMLFDSLEECERVRSICTVCNEQNFDRLEDDLWRELEDRQIVIAREFDAPRELVYAAWTDPEQLAAWWGPKGFRTTTRSFDFREGGHWRHTMHGPDGTDYPDRVDYIKIVPGERLIYTISGDGAFEDLSFEAHISFESIGNKTRVTMRSLFPTAEMLERVVRDFDAIEGGHQTLARLAEHLASRN